MKWKNKRVLVTGSSGVIGRLLVKFLIEEGAIIRGIDIANPTFGTNNRRFVLLQKDIVYLNPLDIISFEPEVVFHLAAAFERTEERLEFWQNNYFNNLLINHKIIDALSYCDSISKFIFASSYLVYDPGLYIFRDKRLATVSLTESSPKNPRNLTGAAKYYAEHELEFFYKNLKRKIQVVNARIFRVYGPGSKDIISRWIRAFLKGEPLDLYNKENSFDYINAGDVALALLKLSETGYTGAVNVGRGVSMPISEVIDILGGLLGKLRIRDKGAIIDFEKTKADIKVLKKLTGWAPAIDMAEGIKTIFEYERGTQ